MEYMLLALLGLLPFGLYRWFMSEDSYSTRWDDNERSDDYYYYYSSLSDSSSDDDNDYYYSSISDTDDYTDPITDPSYCFMEGNIYHDMCHDHDDDHWDDWNTWDDDLSTWDDSWDDWSTWDDDY